MGELTCRRANLVSMNGLVSGCRDMGQDESGREACSPLVVLLSNDFNVPIAQLVRAMNS